ncbi:hypothetical protein [Acrocarpospora sp. B8E8]|uniref:hypothetical protein n=1 Tax=Acrocarpospora sp. B8E8 TaxID=3153572 RepID=UPI00325DB19F
MTAMSYILTAVGGLIAGGTSAYRFTRGDLDHLKGRAAQLTQQRDVARTERDTARRVRIATEERLDAAEQRAGKHLSDLQIARADVEYAQAENRHLLDALALQIQAWEDKGTTGTLDAAKDLRRLIYPPDVAAAIDTALAAEERIAAQIEGRSA